MASKLEDMNLIPGHYAVKKDRFAGFIVRKIIDQSHALVKVENNYGGADTWRKLNVVAMVPPEKAEGIAAALEKADNDRNYAIRAATVSHQLAVKQIIQGYEAWKL